MEKNSEHYKSASDRVFAFRETAFTISKERGKMTDSELLDAYDKWLNEEYDSAKEVCAVVSQKWNRCLFDIRDFVSKYGIDGIECKTVNDPKYHNATMNVCSLFGKRVDIGEYVCHDRKTGKTWISKWDASGKDAELNEYLYLKEKYSDIGRFENLRMKFEKSYGSKTDKTDDWNFCASQCRRLLDEFEREGCLVVDE